MPTSKLLSGSKFLGKDRYDHYLNELLTENTIGGQQLSNAQLKEAFKKRTNKISFEKFVDKVISTKASVGGRGPGSGALVKSPTGAIQKYVQLQTSAGKQEAGNVDGYLKDIIGSLGNIIKTLNAGVTADIKNQEKKRKDKERSKREGVEKGLEKGFSAVKKVIDKVVAPVKSILSRIFDFFVKMILARAIVKLIDWLADPKNQGKVKSLIRFFSDNWVKLLSLYIVFGTSFGKFARGLISLVIRSTIRLGAAVAGLAARAGISKAGKVASFLGGRKGKLLGTALEVGATVVGTMALNKTLEGGEQKTQGLAGGGYVVPRIPTFSGGGFNFKGMLGGIFNTTKPPETTSGFVSGPGGPKDDKVPAMLSDGEFVMSAGAVQKYGVDTFEAMNAAGGGTNKPKVVSGTTYAAGGGMIGGVDSLRARYDSKHGAGAYDKESQRRRDAANARPIVENNLPPLRTGNQEYLRQLKENAGKGTRTTTINGMRVPFGVDPSLFNRYSPSSVKIPQPTLPKVDPNKISKSAESTAKSLFGSFSAATGVGSGKPTSEMEKKWAAAESEKQKILQRGQKEKDINSKARKEYDKIIGDINHPEYDKAWNDPNYLDKLKGKYRSESPAAQKPSVAGYTPYQSRFAGARDAAFAKAKGIQPSRPYVNPFSPGGMFGGPRMQARTDYAAGKGKYYSSSDQKTYANYNDALAAKKSRMTSLASQQTLNKLSYAGASRNKSKGVRIDAEEKARSSEFKSRGGVMGQLGRLGQRMFGGAEAQQRLDAQQKASDARVKQAGAASIGRYYSSSDGKYYKDYNAAKIARDQRRKSAPKPPVKPKPKVTVAGGGQGGRRGSGSSPSTKTSAPAIKASHPSGTRNKQAIHGIKKK